MTNEKLLACPSCGGAGDCHHVRGDPMWGCSTCGVYCDTPGMWNLLPRQPAPLEVIVAVPKGQGDGTVVLANRQEFDQLQERSNHRYCYSVHQVHGRPDSPTPPHVWVVRHYNGTVQLAATEEQATALWYRSGTAETDEPVRVPVKGVTRTECPDCKKLLLRALNAEDRVRTDPQYALRDSTCHRCNTPSFLVSAKLSCACGEKYHEYADLHERLQEAQKQLAEKDASHLDQISKMMPRDAYVAADKQAAKATRELKRLKQLIEDEVCEKCREAIDETKEPRPSTITPEEIDAILKRSEEGLEELRESLESVFRMPPHNIRLD